MNQQPRYGSPNDSGRGWRGAAYTGAGLTAAGGAAYAFGRERKTTGLSAMREGMARSNVGQARIGAVELNNSNTRYDGKPDGRTKAGREIRAAEREIGAGRAQRAWGSKAVSGSKLFRRGGLAALAGGAGLLGAGMVGNDIARSRGMKPKKSNVTSLSEYRQRAGQAGAVVAQSDGKARQGFFNADPKPVDARTRDYLVRNHLIDSDASDKDVHEVMRRLRANGR